MWCLIISIDFEGCVVLHIIHGSVQSFELTAGSCEGLYGSCGRAISYEAAIDLIKHGCGLPRLLKDTYLKTEHRQLGSYKLFIQCVQIEVVPKLHRMVFYGQSEFLNQVFDDGQVFCQIWSHGSHKNISLPDRVLD